MGQSGYYYDVDRIAYYLRARPYSPKLARFLSRDPIGFVGSEWNLYAYVGSSAINRWDPSGLYWGGDDVAGIVGGCLVNAGWSAFWSWWEGDHFRVAACKAGIECVAGALAGWLSTVWPPAGGCLFGAASSISRAVAKTYCNPCPPKNQDCAIWAGFAGAILGCLGSLGIPKVTQDVILKQIISAGLGKLWSHDVSEICKFWNTQR